MYAMLPEISIAEAGLRLIPRQLSDSVAINCTKSSFYSSSLQLRFCKIPEIDLASLPFSELRKVAARYYLLSRILCKSF